VAFEGSSVWPVWPTPYAQFIGVSEIATYLTTDLVLLSPLDAVQGPAERSLGVSDPFSHTGGLSVPSFYAITSGWPQCRHSVGNDRCWQTVRCSDPLEVTRRSGSRGAAWR
jgi:hypothetical protein